jgi:hypothetical protein
MAKTVVRKNLKLFGGSGASGNFGQFGSREAGSPVTTKDLDVIQNLSAWVNGWQDAILSANKAPFLQDMNSLHYVMAYELFYLLQDGIAEWDEDTTYFIGSYVRKPGTSELYSSLTDDNLNNALPDATDDSNWQYIRVGQISGYRRPRLQYNSGETVDVENNTGTANQTVIMFPDGERRTVTENLASTDKYRRFNITATAEFTSGTEESGLRSGLSEANNTWYAIYAVKSQINTDNFVLVGDTTLPLQANFSTLNSRYTTDGWVYLGMIRNGANDGVNLSDILNFSQTGNTFRFKVYSFNLPPPIDQPGEMLLASINATTSQNNNTAYTYASGVSGAQIPSHLDNLLYRLIARRASGSANMGSIVVTVTPNNTPFTLNSSPAGEENLYIIFTASSGGSITVQKNTSGNWPNSTDFVTTFLGWEDPILDGLNNSL